MAGVVISLTGPPRRRTPMDGRRPRSTRPAIRPLAALVVEAALASGLDEVVVATDAETLAAVIPEGTTILLDQSREPSEASALRAAVDWCARAGHESVLVALATTAGKDAPLDPALWRDVAASCGGPVVIGTHGGRRAGPVRIDAQAWPLLPLTGVVEALWRSRPELVTEVAAAVPGSGAAIESRRGKSGGPYASRDSSGRADAPAAPAAEDLALEDLAPEDLAPEDLAPEDLAPEDLVPEDLAPEDLASEELAAEDLVAVEALLGRPAAGRFTVVVRDGSGGPVVIRNEPLLQDGTPMPTRYWLVGSAEREAVSRLESEGGVRAAEVAVPADEIAAAHRRYALERDSALPVGHNGPRPAGGVGGTRTGVKCLHAHLASYLSGTGDPVGSWVVRQLDGQLDGPVAAIDCGTNSTRLLVVDRSGETLDRRTRITRLGAGVDQTGELAVGAIDRTVAVLAEYRTVMDRFGVVRCRAIATSAARDASNAALLFDAAERVLGVGLELLDGGEEGRLSYLGATSELDARDGPFLVVDLGGGSTELAVGPAEDDGADRSVAADSLDVGCVRVTERFLTSDPPTPSEIAAATRYVEGLVDGAMAREPRIRLAKQMVGVAGTVTTLVMLDLGLETHVREKIHHSVVSRARIVTLADELLGETAAERARRPGVEPGRADVIAGGALVLAAVMERTGHRELIASESDILDGTAAELRVNTAAGVRR